MKQADSGRRVFIRNGLVMGCALAAPGLISYRAVSAEQSAGGKVSKEKAEYQQQPNGNEQCSNCMQFVSESGTCKLVQGEISPDAWCKLWVGKS